MNIKLKEVEKRLPKISKNELKKRIKKSIAETRERNIQRKKDFVKRRRVMANTLRKWT